MKKRLIILVVAVLVIVGLSVLLVRGKAFAPKSVQKASEKTTTPVAETKPTPTPAPATQPKPAVTTFNKQMYSTTDPTSIWVIVNKKRPLPSGYAPSDLGKNALRTEASISLDKLLAQAQKDGVYLKVISSYRSEGTQAGLYSSYVAKDGVANADRYSARPGHSEHQTGLAADLGTSACDLVICFGDTKAGIWLANHSADYGFIIRYRLGKEAITGYQYEPWHIRYVGVDLAKQLSSNKTTMEEFFGLAPAPSY